jgi:HEAT repeat protein
MVSGRHEDEFEISPEIVARVLEVLNRISSGPRLILMLNHLKDHTDRAVAEKATVLVARRIFSLPWLQQRLASTDPRIRAGAVQGLWGRDLPSARKLLWQYQKDEDDRVVGNALLGLHLLKEERVPKLVEAMLQDARAPFRLTAVEIMGQVGDPAFMKPLRAALGDNDPGVRLAAKHALAQIRHGILAEAERVAPQPAGEQPEPAVPAVPAVPEVVPEENRVYEAPFEFRFDGTIRSAGSRR